MKVPANGRATVEFLTLDAPYGLTKCEIRIDNADEFPLDDHWLFSVDAPTRSPHCSFTRMETRRARFISGLR